MRITVVIGPFFPMPPAPTGAIEKVWHRLCEAFAARGHEVTVLAPGIPGSFATERLNDVQYVRLPRWNRTGSTKVDLIKDLCHSNNAWRALPEADVTVTNCFWLPVLLRIARRKKVGALNVHVQRFPKRQIRLYRGADRLSTVSEAIADAIRAQAPQLAGIVRVIGNPVDVAVFQPDGPSRREPGCKTILYTGRVHPEKGLAILVKAYARLHRDDATIRLRIIGPTDVARGGGGPAFVASLRAAAGTAPIEFSANIADVHALASALRSCDVYCYPSIAFFGEASPVAPLEAMACGAVPVVSDLPQFGAYVINDVTGLTFPREAPEADAALARQLQRVLHEPATARRLRDAGVERAQAFSVDRIAEAHLEDFAGLVAGRARSS
ncbi:MAG: glycosyltransferase family 4 protein [Phycisphaerae bacterium]|nr:glycosyltransferase family 4 protein [Phycisphaerae bacterium]